jgi:CxxC-x17-CxxC domain-containing protein
VFKKINKEKNNMSEDKFGREMHKVTCSECNQETEVPFTPDGTRPVYCRECYQKHRKSFNREARPQY